jgi:hypothetical protein
MSAPTQTSPSPTDSIDPDIADMFAKAMDKAIDEGKGWKSDADKQKYIEMLEDDDHLPAIFCTNEEELKNAPDAEAFAELFIENEVGQKV